MLTELNLVDGTGFDLPIQSIVSIEGMSVTPNPHFPTAKSYVVLQQPNGELLNLLLLNEFENLSQLVMASNPTNWLSVTQKEGNPLMLMKSAIYQRVGNEEGTEVVLMVSDKFIKMEVKESLEVIRNSMAAPEAPDGVVIM